MESSSSYHHLDSQEFIAKTMRDWVITSDKVGFKPFMGKHGARYTRSLIRRGAIQLPKNPAGVRCMLEVNQGNVSLESLRLVVRLLSA